MKQELQNLLAEYLGELMHKKENTFDWIEKDKVIAKINAVNELLDIGEHQTTFMEAIQHVVKNGIA
jgi:hypothetical protein